MFALGPIARIKRAIGPPMPPFPEAPHQDRLHAGMAEDDGEVVAQIVGLQLPVVRVDVELRDLDRHSELGVLVDDVVHLLRVRQVGAEVSLDADTGERSAAIQ
ncbi:MAG: hypothetical protein SFV18_09355 [Bryobacteraceae bacterium]|nr:hypothetical protein [Bryobacteraceae bacterium]